MAISVSALVFIGAILSLIFVVLLCIGNSSSFIENVSKRLGIGSNDPQRESPKGEAGLMKEKNGNDSKHVQLEEGVSDRYTDAPTTPSADNEDEDTDDDDVKENYDYPMPQPPKATKREIPVPEELRETASKEQDIAENNVRLGEIRKVDDLPAYENAKIGQPKALPPKNLQPKPPVKKDDGELQDNFHLYQNVRK